MPPLDIRRHSTIQLAARIFPVANGTFLADLPLSCSVLLATPDARKNVADLLHATNVVIISIHRGWHR